MVAFIPSDMFKIECNTIRLILIQVIFDESYFTYCAGVACAFILGMLTSVLKYSINGTVEYFQVTRHPFTITHLRLIHSKIKQTQIHSEIKKKINK